MARFYLTTPIYYASDKPHLGHAYTTVVADVLARFYRQQGQEIFFLTGTDEHGAKIERAARGVKQDPQTFVDAQSARYLLAWDTLDISHNDFIRTTEERHVQGVIKFLEVLHASGRLYQGEYRGLYCVGHEAFVKEGELTPDGLCPDHRTKPEEVREQNWFFKLSAYQEELAKIIEGGELRIVPQSRKREVLGFLSGGLEDIAISRPNVSWGIPLPWDEKQTVYVWVDALVNYLSAVGYGSGSLNQESGIRNQERWRFWPVDVHLIGKDILRFHAVIWPALLAAAKLPLPKTIVVHGYFTVDGEKMSKTLKNVLDPVELAHKYGVDAVRYYLLREIPFGEDGDVSLERLEGRYTADLANTLGNLLQRLEKMIADYTGGRIPQVVPAPHDLREVDQLIESFRFHEALKKLWGPLEWANKEIDAKKPWKLAKAPRDSRQRHELEECLSQLASQLAEVAEKLTPFMPGTAKAILERLTAEKITPGKPLFPKLPQSRKAIKP